MTSSGSTFTYWTLLGLSPDSNSNQIKQAFRREAKRWHPDTNRNNRNAEERFKWINEAYKVLSDPGKRFEWEKAGRPSFEIEDKENKYSIDSSNPSEKSYKSYRFQTQNRTSTEKYGFNAAEQLVLLLVAILTLVVANVFLS